MTEQHDLESWIIEAITELGGRAHHVEVARHVWHRHEQEIRGMGDRFYTWQYDLRWAAQRLRNAGDLQPFDGVRDGTWTLTTKEY